MPNNTSETVTMILSRRGLTEPDGRILCLYRVDGDEFEQLKQSIMADPGIMFETIRLTQGLARAFCLYSAEWWRRNHLGGHWAWHGVLESLGLDPDHNRNSLYPLVLDGLHFWKREILRVGGGRGFLVTLSCEGGLPLQLVQREGTALRLYFKALLREFQVFGLRGEEPSKVAARVAGYLPKSLQQEVVYQLCGSLVKEIWELQAHLGETRTPIVDLDSRDPDWRERLPIVVSDDTARALLNNLLIDAATIAGRTTREFRVKSSMIKVGDQFVLQRQILVPPSMTGSELSELFGISPKEIPFRFQLYLRLIDDSNQPVAMITKRASGEEDGLYALEITNEEQTRVRGVSAQGPLRLIGKTSNQEFPSQDMRGGAALSELPWVFVDLESTGREFDFIGEGSVSTKYPDAFVLVEEDAQIYPEQDSSIQSLGFSKDLDRYINHATGTVTIKGNGYISKVRMGSLLEEYYQYVVHGSYLSAGILGTGIYKGLPTVRCFPGTGIQRVIPPSELEWKSQAGTSSWSNISRDCIGSVILRHAPEGETRFITRIQIVPSKGQIVFSPGENDRVGEICLKDFSNPEVGVEGSRGVECSVIPKPDIDSIDLKFNSVGEPPSFIYLHLRWLERQEVGLDLPYPARGGRFFGRDGKIHTNNELVHIDRIGGHKAQVLIPHPHRKFFVEAVLNARDLNPQLQGALWIQEKLIEVTPGRHEMDLYALQDASTLLFSMSEDLDAFIQLNLFTEDRRQLPKGLRIARYDAALDRMDDTGEIVIAENDLDSLDASFCDGVEVKTFPIWDPEFIQDVLEPTSSIRWNFAPEDREPGPWLIAGWQGDFCTLRPYCWYVRKSEDTSGEDIQDVNEHDGYQPSLKKIVMLNDSEERASALDEFIIELSEAPDSPDWKSIDAFIDLLTNLPATTFDVTDRLTRNTAASAMTLLRANEDRFEKVWLNLEKLPFMWELVPVKSWLKGAKQIYNNAHEALHSLSQQLEERDFDALLAPLLEVFVNQAPLRVPGMSCLAELMEVKLLGKPIERTQYLSLACSPLWHQSLCSYLLEEAKQTLYQSHADDIWPGGDDLVRWINDRVEIPAKITTPLLAPLRSGDYRMSVLKIPIMAALGAAYGIQPSREIIFRVRRAQRFDPSWFDAAYGYALMTALGHFWETGEEHIV